MPRVSVNIQEHNNVSENEQNSDKPVNSNMSVNQLSQEGTGTHGDFHNRMFHFMSENFCVSPATDLTFSEGRGMISLLNTGNYSVLYRVMTNASSKFLVKQSQGIVRSGFQKSVTIQVNPNYNATSWKNEKFMLMAKELKEEQETEDFAELWAKTESTDVWKHKLRCVLRIPTVEQPFGATILNPLATPPPRSRSVSPASRRSAVEPDQLLLNSKVDLLISLAWAHLLWPALFFFLYSVSSSPSKQDD